MSDKGKVEACICGFLFCCVLVIALILWILGCNPNVPAGCLTRHVYTGSLVNYTVVWGQCCQGTVHHGPEPIVPFFPNQADKSDPDCVNNDNSCCVADRTWHLVGTNNTCTDTSDIHKSCDMALGTERELAYDSDSGTCTSAETALNMWFAGVTMLGIIASCCCLLCSIGCKMKAEQTRALHQSDPWNLGVEGRLQAALSSYVALD